MSYIDTFKHELLGFLNGLPIYHPLETVIAGKWGDYDFSCSPENLILGGGVGEHPGLVIHRLDIVVAKYLLHDLEQTNKYYSNDSSEYSSLVQSLENFLIDIAYPEKDTNTLEFCRWSMQEISHFVHLAKSPLNCAPFGKDYGSVEEWIELSIGEFVYFSLRDLNPRHTEIEAVLSDKWDVGYCMKNVTCPPPNYIKTKKQSLSDTAFKLTGFFRWDYKYPPEE